MRRAPLLAVWLAGCSLVIDGSGPDADAGLDADAAADVAVDGPAPCPPERCNGADDDCDGEVDEGPLVQPCYPFDDGEPEVGRCAAGEALCEAGAYGVCEGAVGPRAEPGTRGVDDDCDGTADEA